MKIIDLKIMKRLRMSLGLHMQTTPIKKNMELEIIEVEAGPLQEKQL